MKQKNITAGMHCSISDTVKAGNNVKIGHNCIIEDDVILGDGVYIDSNTIIRSGVTIGNNSIIGSNCIIGEYLMDFYMKSKKCVHPLKIGENALIRSGSIMYGDSIIGTNFQTGHHVTIRENTEIGDNVSVGTLSDIQGRCQIGNYVRLHSNVHIGQMSKIDDYVWIFPYVILTNDPTPPSDYMLGVHIHSFAVVAAGAILLPGAEIGSDSLVAAGAIVTKSVEPYAVIAGNPGKVISDVRKIKDKRTGQSVYPWREHFNRAMPWEKVGFEKWYASLDLQQKKLVL